MNDTLKVAGRIGAELGAAKAENDRLRGLLREVIACQSAHYGDGCGLHLSMITLAGRIKDALSQQAETVRCPGTEDTASMDSDSAQEQYTAVDMATAAAQGFRDGQAAVEQAPVQDEREAVERFSPTTSVPHCGRASEVEAYMTEDDDGEYMTVSQHERIVAALSAQTAPQGLRIVLDGPPGPEAGRFVEVENAAGRSVNAGEWRERVDGLWELVLHASQGGE